jgi:hypothetical protein
MLKSVRAFLSSRIVVLNKKKKEIDVDIERTRAWIKEIGKLLGNVEPTQKPRSSAVDYVDRILFGDDIGMP